MALMNWGPFGGRSPFDDLWAMQDGLNRFFDDRGSDAGVSRYPPVNAWVSDDEIIVDLEMPGVETKDLDISVTGTTLVLTGKRVPQAVKEGETYHRRERRYGSFGRTLELPFRVDSDRIRAAYRNGILRVTLPRAAEDRPKRISVQAA